ncbi:hypothetical protein BDL97_03G033000 [Sphagnum fallax]|nr:hypothetical protein BDL97_03G033000 [Sphagnum fallax]
MSCSFICSASACIEIMEAASSIMDAGTRGCLSREGNMKRNYNTSGSAGHWDCKASVLVPDHDGSAEKIQEMLSRAINDQQQLWKILLSASSSSSDQLAGSSSDQLGESVDGEQLDQAGIEVAAGDTRRRQQQQLVGITCTPEFNLPARLFRPLAAKLENSLDWCYLALCRIQDLTSQLIAARELPRSTSALPIVNQQVSSVRPCCTGYSILEHEEFHDQLRPSFHVRLHPNAVSKLKLYRSSLSPLQIPGRTMDSSSLVDEASLSRSPTSLCLLNKSPKTESTSLAAAPSDWAGDEAGRVDESRITLASDLQGQNFDHGRISAALGVMDHPADWPNLQADSDMAIAATTDSKEPQQLMIPRLQISSSKAVLLRSSSSNHLKMGQDAHDHLISPQNNQGTIRRTDSLDGRSITSTSTIRCNPTREEKRDKEAVIDAEEDGNTSVVVVYQRLRPGVDRSLKGIPPDGHRRWKKYGNKAIQNANFSRGYYKCSVKECNAKKMVQKTDKDPSVFEVTYTGTHTCSSSMGCTSNYNPQYNKKQKTGNSLNVQAPGAATAHDVPAARKVFDHESPKHTTSDHHQAAAQLSTAPPVCSQELEQDQTSPAAAASHEDRNNRYYASTKFPSIALDVCSAPSTEEDQAVVEEKVLHHQQETANSSATAAASAACWSEFARFEHAADQQFMSSSDLEAAISTESSSSLDHAGRIKSEWKKFALDQQQLDYAETVDMDSLYMLNLQDSAMSSWPELLPDN